ncbi:ABC transporter ATP-binding protein [Tsukamurella serpentis]
MNTPESVTAGDARLATVSGGDGLRWLLSGLRRHGWLTAATALSTVLGAVGQVVPILLLQKIVDGVGRPGVDPADLLLSVGIPAAIAAIVGAVLTGLSTYLIGRLGALLLAELREGVVHSVLRLPSTRIEQAGRGDVLARVGDDVAQVAQGVAKAVPTVLSAAVLVAIAVAGMFGLDWRLGLAGAMALPFYAIALRWYLPRSAPLYRQQRIAQGERSQAVIAGLDGIDTVRAYRIEGPVVADVRTRSRRVRDLGIEAFGYFGRFVGRENRAEFIGLALIVIVGAALLPSGAITLGAVASASLLFHRLFGPIGAILFTFDSAQRAGASMTRLVGVLHEAQNTPMVGGPGSAPGVDSNALPVTFDGVGFRYPGSTHAVIEDVSFEIPAGGTLALVGATGAGKSTVAALLGGLQTANTGRIDIGGIDVGADDPTLVRRAVGLLTQETHVFSGSLADDLRLADPEATDAELIAALTIVGADDWLRSLPDGLETAVGDGGEPLDGTVVARLALAKLVLGRFPVVVLDESTAEAGSKGAADLERAAAAACDGRTALLVAHRLSQAAVADRIAVLDAGRIVEYGSHDELVAANGRYATFWKAWQAGT